jgi:hypothetical protein
VPEQLATGVMLLSLAVTLAEFRAKPEEVYEPDSNDD